MPAPPPPEAGPDLAPPSTGREPGPSPVRLLPLTAVTILALVMRLLPVLRGGGLRGMDTHDPYVYYAGGVALAAGELPYRDFLFLHPPGILLAVQPFVVAGGWLGDDLGLALGRIGFLLIGIANVLLLYRLLAPAGTVAATVGAGLYAVWVPAVYVERTIRLETLGTLLLLLSLLLVTRSSRSPRPAVLAAGAGAMVGLGATVKLWGAIPAAVIVLWLLWCYGWRVAAAAAAGAATAVVAVIGPFAVAAPNWFDALVLEHLGRERSAVGLAGRLLGIVGLPGIPPPWSYLVLAVAGSLTAAALVIAMRTREGRLPALLVAAGTVVLLAGPTWYRHYPAFVAAPLCLVFGCATAVVAARLAPAWRGCALAGVAVVVAAAAAVQLSLTPGRVIPISELRQVIDPRPGCVTSDRPSATLVLTDRLRRNLAEGCPLVIDVVGHRVTRDAGDTLSHSDFMLDYLASAPTAVMLMDLDDFQPAQREQIRSWPVVADFGRTEVRQPG